MMLNGYFLLVKEPIFLILPLNDDAIHVQMIVTLIVTLFQGVKMWLPCFI